MRAQRERERAREGEREREGGKVTGSLRLFPLQSVRQLGSARCALALLPPRVWVPQSASQTGFFLRIPAAAKEDPGAADREYRLFYRAVLRQTRVLLRTSSCSLTLTRTTGDVGLLSLLTCAVGSVPDSAQLTDAINYKWWFQRPNPVLLDLLSCVICTVGCNEIQLHHCCWAAPRLRSLHVDFQCFINELKKFKVSSAL